MAQIADVIKYEGDNSTFVWKHPLEDFNSMSQLIVHESQEAIFFMNGQALDLFGAGRYTLETQNIPKIGKFLNRTTGDQTPFHCEVYFVNKTEQMSIKWGTDSRVQYVEPLYGFPLSIGACGEMSLRAEDSRKLLLKLVGTENYLSQARLVDYFRALLMTKIKSYIAQTMKAKAINIFEIDENLDAFSSGIKELLVADFAEYGVMLEKFWVTTVLKPDGEPQYEEFKNLHFANYTEVARAKLDMKTDEIRALTKARRIEIEAEAEAKRRQLEGITSAQEHGFTVMEKVAENEGVGSNVQNAFMGFGMGIGTGGAIGSAINTIANETIGSGVMNPLGNVGSSVDEISIPGMINLKSETDDSDNNMEEFEKKLKMLTKMKETGLLSDEEFAKKKQEILDRL